MAMTSREQKLALILPALAVIAIYGLFPFRYQYARKTQVNAEAARSKPPVKEVVLEQQSRLQVVQREIDDEAKQLATAEKRWQAAAGKGIGVPSWPQRIERLNEMFAAAGLQVIEAGDVESIRDNRGLPALDAAARELTELSENQQPRRWQVRFRGTYADVHATLDQLANGNVIAVPLGLTMKAIKGAADDFPWREWTLQVWV